MKKKLLWIAALFAVSALIVIGCPTGGGDDPPPPEDVEFWLASDNEGTELGKDTVKLIGDDANEQYVYIFYNPVSEKFDKIKINYTFGESGIGFNMRWQCAYDDTGTWGSVSSNDNYIGWQEEGPSECDPTTMFVNAWGATGTALNKATMKGICLAVSVPAGSEANFKLINVELIGGSGSGSGGGGGGNNNGPIVIFDGSNGGFVTGASIETSSSVTATASNITITWNTADQGGAFRGKVNLASAARADLTSYTKFKMDWSASTGTSGSFNISLYFPNNRMLSKTVNSGTAEFHFVNDHPDWAAGTSWGGAEVGTITGFEIFSDNSAGLGAGPLVITKIWFE
jgi:hypothetical protein